MFIGIHFLKINLWGNIAKVWAKRVVVGSRLKIENGYVSAANETFRVTELTIEVSVNQESLIEVGPTIQKPKIEFTPFEDLIARHRQISELIHIRGRIASISNSSKQVVVKVVDDEDLDIQVIFSKDRFDPALEKDSLLSVTFGKLCHYEKKACLSDKGKGEKEKLLKHLNQIETDYGAYLFAKDPSIKFRDYVEGVFTNSPPQVEKQVIDVTELLRHNYWAKYLNEELRRLVHDDSADRQELDNPADRQELDNPEDRREQNNTIYDDIDSLSESNILQELHSDDELQLQREAAEAERLREAEAERRRTAAEAERLREAAEAERRREAEAERLREARN